MRKQLSVTLACFLLASVSASAQGWKAYEEAAQGKAYEKSDCVTLLDSTLVASRLTWNKGGEETTKISYYNKEGQDVLEDFTGDSFIMETLYAPQENVLDKIWSKPVKYTK